MALALLLVLPNAGLLASAGYPAQGLDVAAITSKPFTHFPGHQRSTAGSLAEKSGQIAVTRERYIE
jgi:hypothetical protein